MKDPIRLNDLIIERTVERNCDDSVLLSYVKFSLKLLNFLK